MIRGLVFKQNSFTVLLHTSKRLDDSFTLRAVADNV